MDWPRTTRDPFEGVWEQILSWVLAHPEYSSSDLFQLLQQESPERYRPSQLGTLQRGVRKIRAHLLRLMEEPWPHEVIQARSRSDQREHEGDLLQEQGDAPSLPQHSRAEEVVRGTSVSIIPVANTCTEQPMEEGRQTPLALEVARSPFLGQESPQIHLPTITIEGTIALSLQEQKGGGRGRKTLQWHQTALGLWQQYLVDECHLGFLGQITSDEVRGWLAFLRTPSSTTGRLREASTIATYGRSVRAFCHWAVQKGYLDRTPLGRGILPTTEKKRMHLVKPEAFDRLLLVCQPGGDLGILMDRGGARNRAILWVLLDTGMRACELCGLRLSDVDREKRSLRVEGRGKARWLRFRPLDGTRYSPTWNCPVHQHVRQAQDIFCRCTASMDHDHGRFGPLKWCTRSQHTLSLVWSSSLVCFLKMFHGYLSQLLLPTCSSGT